MKTKEELSALKSEVEALNRKLSELSEEELSEVAGGFENDLVERVLRGDYGNGQERRKALRADGYDYGFVQSAVDRRLGYETKFREWSNGEQQN